ncbi:hypothetical protein ES288_A06G209100v1 [Gossypium darwinii]|uniref:DC1 domain-containing protein n=1 Tax=Gossypium darwinii TaxID=34276 RepID=A0A5D2G8V1_GOSDA|nr:hypothetical protein ES288_A06G209100v1 [Gossypium darwinii]
MEMKNENENESVSESEDVSLSESVNENKSESENENEKQSNEGLKAYCDGCGELLSAPCFTCIHCNYHLHKQCAKAPLVIPNHPLHPRHSNAGFFLRQRPHPNDDWVFGCALCKEKPNMFFYECRICYFSLVVKCAKLSSSYKFSQHSKHDIHKHPLTLIESPMTVDVLKRFNCSWCHELLIDAIYVCFDCQSFIIHKKCLDELSTKINPSSYHMHSLFLNYSHSDCFCNLCQNEHSRHFYCCSLCHFNINFGCALLRSTVEDQRRHPHPFSLLWRQGSFICDACDIEGNYISYICLTCNFMVHKDCTQLPRIIKLSRHVHCIFHKYFLEDLTRKNCKICFNEVKLNRGSYSCVKQGCSYVVYVNCVLEDKNLYKVIEEEKQCEELYEKPMQSSIIHVIEVNKLGEDTKIEHFKKCDGCMLSISTLFYYCLQCLFFLHKTCAGFPRIKQHWFDKGMCLSCAKVDDIIKCEGHQHFLFFYFKCKEKCNDCGNSCGHGAFRSHHKVDEHMLKLTYDVDKEQSCCDICEQKRYPSLWYYSCSICDTSAHLKYVLGQFPFLGDGSRWPYKRSHNHDLYCFRKAEGYPKCSCCGKLCQEEILKCEKSTCNYIIHHECPSY